VGTDFSANQTLTIEGLYFKNFAIANQAKPGLKVFVGGAGDTFADSWDVKTIMIKGVVTLGDHFQGQVGDKFAGETESATTTEFFRFRLNNDGEPASTTLTVDLSSINGIVTGDVTDVQLWADVDGLGDVTAPDPTGVWNTYERSPVTSVYSLTFDSDNNVLYAGAGNGTIYRCETSTGCDDNGDWTVSFPTPDNQIRSLFFDSVNNAIYAGSNNDGIIYRCDTASGCDETDGSEWVECYNTPATTIYAFALDTANNVIYAASADIGAATIYRCDASTGCDDPSEWTISHSTTHDTIYSLTFDSVNNVLYAGSSNSGIIYRCETASGCDETTDWATSYDTPATSIYSLTFDATNKILYAGSSDGPPPATRGNFTFGPLPLTPSTMSSTPAQGEAPKSLAATLPPAAMLMMAQSGCWITTLPWVETLPPLPLTPPTTWSTVAQVALRLPTDLKGIIGWAAEITYGLSAPPLMAIRIGSEVSPMTA
jgi:hypothetical protein